MAIRTTTHILKNSDIINRPLPSNLFKGEAIVNTAEGIMFFSGVTTSTSGWTQANPSTPTFWEVGSNLYDLKIRNKIITYGGISNLTGKFLSGTTNGFVLNDISAINGSDSYVTGFTYSNNIATINQNNNQPPFSILINTMTGLTINGVLSATTFNTNNFNLSGGITSYNGLSNLSGFFLSGTTNGFELAPMSAITAIDTYTTGLTYTPNQNKITLSRNLGNPDLNISLNTLSGISISNLTSGRVVFAGTGGALSDDAGFTYNSGTNTLSTPSDGTINIGTGGLNVDGNTVIQGSLTVFGPSVSAFTSQLYVEDSNITLNYNPTGNTIATSIGAGWTLQDGNGIAGGDVTLDIRRMDTLTGLTSTQIPSIVEYLASTGFANRGWVTQLNDIVIRSTNTTTPNGVRVLAEWDVLDGGSY